MKKQTALSGILIGVTNVLIGACGGIIAVKSLKKEEMDQTCAHATSIAVILPLTLFSAIIYLSKGFVNFSEATFFMIPGILGAIFGSYLLRRISNKNLKKIFSLFIIYAGFRMFFK